MSKSLARSEPGGGGSEAASAVSSAEEMFRSNPVRFVELARDWAMGGEAPNPDHEKWLSAMPRRRIRKPDSAREALWSILSARERGRALAWLDSVGLLDELIPIWWGDERPRKLHLQAVEEVHRERWAERLSPHSLEKLNAIMNQPHPGRLDGWALAALAALLLESNGHTERYSERLNEELKELGATDEERMRVMTAVIEYPFLRTMLRGEAEHSATRFSPTTVVAALATMFADPDIDEEQRKLAVKLADQVLNS
jgi:hypothetical protein